jgi:O-antigen/teichoic acid export membrane protein
LGTDISVRKTGLVVFTSRILSIFTGLGFLVMLTRSLGAAQFGLWEVITDVALFASYPAGIVVYWATREVARGKPVGKTTVTLNLILSTLGLALYVLFSVMTYPSIHSSLGPFLVGLVLIPAGYWNQAVNAIAVGHRPAVIGYSLLASEIFKLLAAFPLLFILGYGINGVILAVLVSYVSQASVSTYMLRDVMSGSVLLVEGRRC